jgi:hypothetical protein
METKFDLDDTWYYFKKQDGSLIFALAVTPTFNWGKTLFLSKETRGVECID